VLHLKVCTFFINSVRVRVAVRVRVGFGLVT
jgi:hypothetical protein